MKGIKSLDDCKNFEEELQFLSTILVDGASWSGIAFEPNTIPGWDSFSDSEKATIMNKICEMFTGQICTE